MAAAASAKNFNILTVDGGAIRGIIPAEIIDKMELYAREYANTRPYRDQVPKRADWSGKVREDRVHMMDVFDLMGGTSAGSMVTGALATPISVGKKEPKFFADRVTWIFKNKGSQLFLANQTPYFWIFCTTFMTSAALAGIGYGLGWYFYDNQAVIDEFARLERTLRKAQENDDHIDDGDSDDGEDQV